jgi:hypothetical protein
MGTSRSSNLRPPQHSRKSQTRALAFTDLVEVRGASDQSLTAQMGPSEGASGRGVPQASRGLSDPQGRKGLPRAPVPDAPNTLVFITSSLARRALAVPVMVAWGTLGSYSVFRYFRIRRTWGGESPPDRSAAAITSAASRLLRAYTIQVETLRRLRSGGSQLMRVEHVHVNEGGQAVIGPVAVDRT